MDKLKELETLRDQVLEGTVGASEASDKIVGILDADLLENPDPPGFEEWRKFDESIRGKVLILLDELIMKFN